MCSSWPAFCFLFIWSASLKWFGRWCLTLPSNSPHKAPSSKFTNCKCDLSAIQVLLDRTAKRTMWLWLSGCCFILESEGGGMLTESCGRKRDKCCAEHLMVPSVETRAHQQRQHNYTGHFNRQKKNNKQQPATRHQIHHSKTHVSRHRWSHISAAPQSGNPNFMSHVNLSVVSFV